MSGTLIHLAVADKIYDISGSSIVKTSRYFSAEISHRMQCMRKKIIKEEIKSIPICAMIYTHMVMAIRK